MDNEVLPFSFSVHNWRWCGASQGGSLLPRVKGNDAISGSRVSPATSNRRNRWIAIGALLVAAGGFGWWALVRNHPPDPIYKGKRVSSWMEEAFAGGSARAEFIQNARDMGEPAIAQLVYALHTRDTKLRRGVRAARKRLPKSMAEMLPAYQPAAAVRGAAASLLGDL